MQRWYVKKFTRISFTIIIYCFSFMFVDALVTKFLVACSQPPQWSLTLNHHIYVNNNYWTCTFMVCWTCCRFTCHWSSCNLFLRILYRTWFITLMDEQETSCFHLDTVFSWCYKTVRKSFSRVHHGTSTSWLDIFENT